MIFDRPRREQPGDFTHLLARPGWVSAETLCRHNERAGLIPGIEWLRIDPRDFQTVGG
ncbi:hypothetical protein RSSM_00415 [Rhodopirellula sallentina SM41]|uniref:Uncharacterized protein n=1 Tax=Rhodopirellula sallentina SM41 TaxID=1263870 RepID=M5U9N9_9BACT|nr:hypothetical protein RSSM_00415 [Rhodopirellula sallentina SM41]